MTMTVKAVLISTALVTPVLANASYAAGSGC